MSYFIDITGKKFHNLTVISRHGTYRTEATWLCKCDCGKTTVVRSSNLKTGSIKGCGCLKKYNSTTHGLSKSVTYKSWVGMKSRCFNPSEHYFKRYGGRGIAICKEWEKSFESFFDDMGERPSPKHSLDRIENDGNYEPGNCRWATKKEQAQNTSTNILREHNGKILPSIEWSRKLGGSYDIVGRRIRKGWSISKAITTPIMSEYSRHSR